MKRFEFKTEVGLSGYGNTEEEAKQDAIEKFYEDPTIDRDDLVKVSEEDAD